MTKLRNVFLPKFLLKAYGFWDFNEHDNWLFRVHRTVGISIFVLGFSALENIRLIAGFMEKTDLAKTTDDLAHAINHVLCAYKFFLFLSQRKFIQSVYEQSIQDDRVVYHSIPEFDRVRHEAVNGYTKMNFLGTSLGILSASFFIVLGYAAPFLANSVTYYADSGSLMTTRPLPFNTWVPFPEGLLPNYYWVFAYQGISMIDVVLMVMCFDCTINGMLGQVAGQFRILNYAASTIKQRARVIAREKVSSVPGFKHNFEYKSQYAIEMQNELRECIIHHKMILRTCQQINKRFNYIMLFQFSTTLIVFCVCLFQCLVRSGLRLDFLYMIFYAITCAYELFYFCWFGKEVIEQSSRLPTALFSSYWVDATPQFRSNYRLFLMRSHKPVVFTAVGLFPLNLSTFGSIIKTGYSLFSVLQRINYE